MEAVAKLRNYPTAPRKMRLVVDMIRGLDVDQALNVLRFSKKHASKPMEKVLLCAINNWEQANKEYRAEDSDLFVKAAFVDAGRTLKRFQPAPMGRAHRIRKRSNHITIVVDSRTIQNLPVVEEPAEVETTEE